MSNMLEIKEVIKKFYAKYDVYVLPVLKFLLALVVLLGIKGRLGYMPRLNSIAIILIVSLLCSFLPVGFMIFFAAVFVLLHCYSLAMEAALVVACLFILMLLLFFRFSPKESVCVLLTPICFALHIPYVMPIAMGLIGTPASAIAVACGTVIHYLTVFISQNAQTLGAGEASEAVARIRLMIDGLLGNKTMIIVVVAFVMTVALVYLIRRLSVDHSWTIAIIAGTISNIMIILVGDLMYDINVSVVALILGSLGAALLVLVLQFFVFSVDYSRTEKVQFEDDEYYYYVKAVPKMAVAVTEKTVKKINTQTGRSVHTQTVRDEHLKRPVSTERQVRRGNSVTIGTKPQPEYQNDDYEEI